MHDRKITVSYGPIRTIPEVFICQLPSVTLDHPQTLWIMAENQIFNQYVGDEIAYAARQLGHSGTLANAVKSAMEAVGLMLVITGRGLETVTVVVVVMKLTLFVAVTMAV